MREFLLMNKDVRVISFKIVRNQLGMQIVPTSKVLNPLPLGLKDMRLWLESRYILEYRVVTKEFFKSLGIVNLEDFIEVTNCVSLNDTYWVKNINSRVSWKSVSPYRNTLNRVISEYSFTGRINGKNITSSPDFSTDGNFPKCWRRKNGVLYLYKAGSSGAVNSGNEPYSEVYAYRIAKLLKMDCVPYSLGNYKDRLVSICPNMCNGDIGFKQYNVATGNYNANFIKLLEDFKYDKRVLDMLLLDYLTCNIDRHYGNFGYLVENSTQKILSFAPLYDHNLSCVPYYMEDEDLEYYIGDIRAKDGSTFDELFRMIDCKYVRYQLESLWRIKNKWDTDICIGGSRDRVVKRMLNNQICKTLG